MTPADFERVRDLVESAQRLPPAEREGFLDAQCESKLRAEVASLLRLDGQVPSQFLMRRGERSVHSAGTIDYVPERQDSGDASLSPRYMYPALPNFEILGILGKGGMGIVYRAQQLAPTRPVALKMMLLDSCESKADRMRFRAEAEAVAQLEHPNIIRIYQLDEYEGQLYFSMEFIAGGSLSAKTKGIPMSPVQAATLVARLARAVHFAHQRGILHRDLKPGNVLLAPADAAQALHLDFAEESGSYEPKIADFGLAKFLQAGGDVRKTVGALGTPSYMPPEQADPETQPLGPTADVYGLGAILYDLLVGRPPFRGRDALDTLDQVRQKEAVPPRQLQPKIPRDLETICLKCLEKEPHKRYANAQALAEDLRRCVAHEPIQARPVGIAGRAWRWRRRNPALAAALAAIAAALLCIVVGAITGFLIWHDEEQRRLQSEQARKFEARVYRDNLRAESNASEALALAELQAGRLESALNILHKSSDRLRKETDAEWRQRLRWLDDRRQQTQRLVDFYRLADETEQIVERRVRDDTLWDSEEPTAKGEQALTSLGLRSSMEEWWLHLPVADLLLEQREKLRADVYRHLLLVAVLHAARSVKTFVQGANPDAYRACLDKVRLLHRDKKSYTGEVLELFCRLGLREFGKAKAPSLRAPTSAPDAHYLGTLHVWLSLAPDDPLTNFFMKQAAQFVTLDLANPLATAERHLRQALVLQSDFYWSHYWLGMALLDGGKVGEAEVAANACIALRPAFEAGYSLRTAAILEMVEEATRKNRREELLHRGITGLDQAVSKHGAKFAWAYVNRAMFHNWNGDHDSALVDFREALRLEPRNRAALQGRNATLQAKGDFAAVLADLDDVLRADPGFAEAHHDKAFVLLNCPDAKLRNPKAAAAAAAKACELGNWSDPFHIQTLAQACASTGDFPAAIRWQEKALAMAAPAERESFQSSLDFYRRGQTPLVELSKPDFSFRPRRHAEPPAPMEPGVEQTETSIKLAFNLPTLLNLPKLQSGKVHFIGASSGSTAFRLQDLQTQRIEPDAPVPELTFIPREPGQYRLHVHGPTDAASNYVVTMERCDSPTRIIASKLAGTDPFDNVKQSSHAKVHQVQLDAGKTYLMELESTAFDTFLRLEDSGGQEATSDNNSGLGTNSRLIFTPTFTSQWGVVVTSAVGGQMGDYVLTVQSLDKKTRALSVTFPLRLGAFPPTVIKNTAKSNPNNTPAPTPIEVAIGKPFSGVLSRSDLPDKLPPNTGKPYKAHVLSLQANRIYGIDLKSKDFDPYLRLEDSSGKQILSNDDTNGLDSRITFKPVRSDQYRLIAITFDWRVGRYELVVSDQSIDELSPTTIKLDLSKTAFTDEDATQIHRFRKLRSLNLSATKISDQGLAHIKRLQDLDYLSLAGTKVTVAGLANVKDLVKLRSLNLFGTETGDTGLAHLKSLTALEELNLGQTQVTDAGLSAIAHLKKLKTLLLTNLRISDRGLAQLATLKNLQCLTLTGTQVTDAGLEILRDMRSLTQLQLWRTQVTDKGLETLSSMSQLQLLHLGGKEITDKGLPQLVNLTHLRLLLLLDTQVTAAGTNELQKALPLLKIHLLQSPKKS